MIAQLNNNLSIIRANFCPRVIAHQAHWSWCFPGVEEGFGPHFVYVNSPSLLCDSVLSNRSKCQQSREGSFQCLFLSFGPVCILPLFLLRLRTSLSSGFSQGLLSSPCLKAVMITYPNIVTASTPQLSSCLVVFLKISIDARKQMVEMQHVLHIMIIYYPFF